MTAQLIDVNTDEHLWSQSFDRELKNFIALRSEIAKQVADSLRVRILSPEMARIDRKPTENATAYTLYLKGRYFWNKRGIEDVKKAVGLFQQAAEEDPKFAQSYLGLADCFLILRNNWAVDVEANQKKAETMFTKAVEFDPSLAEAHATMGLLLLDDYHLREAEGKFRKAIELKPSYAVACMWYHILLRAQLRWDEALYQIGKAMELDPLSTIVNWNHATYYFARREYGKALELYRRVAELDPTYSPTYGMMAWSYGIMKRFDDMKRNSDTQVELLQRSFPLFGKNAEAWDARLRDDKGTVKRLLPELETHLDETNTDAGEIAGLYFYLGDEDKGFEWLERSYARREFDLLNIKFRDSFDNIRSDPRYFDILKRLGLDQQR